MKEMKFTTNINCGGCLSKVTPKLNEEQGIDKWEVDLQDPKKVLTVKVNNATEEDIMRAVRKAGFQIQQF